MRTAPVLVTVWTSERAYLDRYAEPDKGWTDRDKDRWSAPYWWVDAGMAAMNVLLAAVDAGLGACFFGIPTNRREAVRVHFGVPGDQLSVGVDRHRSPGRREIGDRPLPARNATATHGSGAEPGLSDGRTEAARSWDDGKDFGVSHREPL